MEKMEFSHSLFDKAFVNGVFNNYKTQTVGYISLQFGPTLVNYKFNHVKLVCSRTTAILNQISCQFIDLSCDVSKFIKI